MKAVFHAQECAGSHTAATISMAFENMFETWKHEHTPTSIQTTDWRNKLINCVCIRHDTICHGIETVNKRFGGIFSEPLYCVATMFDARYKDRYFDADKKTGFT
jgi:hypothetical protein